MGSDDETMPPEWPGEWEVPNGDEPATHTLTFKRAELEAIGRSLVYARSWLVERIGDGSPELPKIDALGERIAVELGIPELLEGSGS